MQRALFALFLVVPLSISLSTPTGESLPAMSKPSGSFPAALESDRIDRLRPAPTVFIAPIPQVLDCNPAPCVLPNVDASAGPMPVDETPVAVNPRNRKQLLSSGNDFNCSPNFQGYYSSDDGGNTWTHTCVTPIGGYFGGGDPSIAYDLQGNAYASGLEISSAYVVGIQKSANNGKTWGKAKDAMPQMFSGGYIDKDWLKIDISAKSPFVNRLYVCAEQADASENSLIAVSHSSDGGNAWTDVAVESKQRFPVLDDLCYMAVKADGTVYLTWVRCTDNPQNHGCGGSTATVEFSESTDGGDTWTTPTAILNIQVAPYITCKQGNFGGFYGVLPNTCDRVDNNPIVTIDDSNGPHKGNLYLAYSTWTGKFLKVFVARSSDGGITWKSAAIAPGTEKHDQFFPWISVNRSGLVGVSWLDRRNDPKNVSYEAFAAFSNNGGNSFGKNIDLSAKPSNPFHDGFRSGSHFMGDYIGNAWSTDGKVFYVSFTDTSTGVEQDFIGGYKRQ